MAREGVFVRHPEGRAAHPATTLRLAMVGLLLFVNAGLAQPAAPDTVVGVPYTPAEDEGFGEGDHVLVTFDAVEGAVEYDFWREILAPRWYEEEQVTEPLPATKALWGVGSIDADATEHVVRAVLGAGAPPVGVLTGRWAVRALHHLPPEYPRQGIGFQLWPSEYHYFQVQTEGTGTRVRAASWADVKWLSRGVR